MWTSCSTSCRRGTLTLSPSQGSSRASPTACKRSVSIDSIREVCEGKRSEIFQRYSEGSFDPNCCFSLYYGEHMESLDLVSGTREEARTWITGLKYLMAGISDEDSLAKRQRTRDQYPYPSQWCGSGSALKCFG
nr:1-phosphatidylinositol 4,5-bisphosphate phosphodiesterase eta-2-like [Nothobranchius furzeri]